MFRVLNVRVRDIQARNDRIIGHQGLLISRSERSGRDMSSCETSVCFKYGDEIARFKLIDPKCPGTKCTGFLSSKCHIRARNVQI